jgi:hypothetical protein
MRVTQAHSLDLPVLAALRFAHRLGFELLGKPVQSYKNAPRGKQRSGVEVAGYRIEAADGPIGHVEDFIVDDADWGIVDMVADTRDWLPGKTLLVPPSAIADIHWENRRCACALQGAELKAAPEAPE